MAQKDSPEFLKIPQSDTVLINEQKPSIQKFWNQCWLADPYGSRWMEIAVKLSDRAFRIARHFLSAANLFLFKRECNYSDGRKTSRWLVKNLHGARVKIFWRNFFSKSSKKRKKRDEKPIPDKEAGLPHNSSDVPDNGIDMLSNLSKNQEVEQIEELKLKKNMPETSQELKHEVLETSHSQATLQQSVSDQSASVVAIGSEIPNTNSISSNPAIQALMDFCSIKAKGGDFSEEEKLRNMFKRYKFNIGNECISWCLSLSSQELAFFWSKFEYSMRHHKQSPSAVFDKLRTSTQDNENSAAYAEAQQQLAARWKEESTDAGG